MMTTDIIKIGIAALALLIAGPLGGLFVKKMLLPFADQDIPQGFQNAGKYIGILERSLISLFLLMNQITLIGFILTIKAIYRFGDIQGDNRVKMKISEYFIIGTFLSLLWTLLIWLIYSGMHKYGL